MQRKKMTLRFDLDRPEDRQAWEYLQGLNPASMNKAVLSIINQAELTSRIQTVLIFVLCYGLGVGIYLSTDRNYRRREEHGSAKWGSAQAASHTALGYT